jgi:hypothetical protein
MGLFKHPVVSQAFTESRKSEECCFSDHCQRSSGEQQIFAGSQEDRRNAVTVTCNINCVIAYKCVALTSRTLTLPLLTLVYKVCVFHRINIFYLFMLEPDPFVA